MTRLFTLSLSFSLSLSLSSLMSTLQHVGNTYRGKEIISVRRVRLSFGPPLKQVKKLPHVSCKLVLSQYEQSSLPGCQY